MGHLSIINSDSWVIRIDSDEQSEEENRHNKTKKEDECC